MIISKAKAIAVARTFKAVFAKALAGAAESVFYPKIAQTVTTTAGVVDYTWLAAIPGMKELKGAADISNLELINWVIPNKEWHDTIAVKEKDVEQDQLGLYTQRFEMLGDAAARHPDELAAEALLAGFVEKDYTGKAFFATNKKHFPSLKTTFSNKLEAALDAAAFEEARELLKTMKIEFPDGSETKLKLGRDLCLIVSAKNETIARQILEAERIDGGDSNVNKGTATLEVWTELGDSLTWYLVDKAHMAKPLVFQEEKKASLNSVTDPQDSYVLLNHEFLHQAYGRYAVGYFLPQLIIGSTGVDA